jgi:methylthioribose-1-phosphate isomerase
MGKKENDTESEREAIESISWRDDHVRLIDQSYLPLRLVYTDIRDVGQMWQAIKKLKVRGAPAIGIAAAYGLYLGSRELPERSFNSFWMELKRVSDYLSSARPTAVNLDWALNRIQQDIYAHKEDDISDLKERILKIAQTIHEEDKRTCKKIGEHGVSLVSKGDQILTHCNTGSLATGQYGTALSVIYHTAKEYDDIHVWVDETRPLLQGARLTAWELQQAEVPMTLIIDSAAASLMQAGKVDLVIVGADRVAANGDAANKIGTYALATLARAHDIPFYVALPLSTIDLDTATGDDIEIEERDADEVTHFGESQSAPDKTPVYNPAFDVTPAELITGFITEEGVFTEDFEAAFKKAKS